MPCFCFCYSPFCFYCMNHHPHDIIYIKQNLAFWQISSFFCKTPLSLSKSLSYGDWFSNPYGGRYRHPPALNACHTNCRSIIDSRCWHWHKLMVHYSSKKSPIKEVQEISWPYYHLVFSMKRWSIFSDPDHFKTCLVHGKWREEKALLGK